MTGPERQTLDQALELLRDFRRELREDIGVLRTDLGVISTRLTAVEVSWAIDSGLAERRAISRVRFLAMFASAATVGGVIVGFILKVV